VSSFVGFRPAAFRFLRDLSRPANCNKEWFDAHRERYDAEIVSPLKALVEQIGPALQRLDDSFEVAPKTNKTITRINRDMRFARNQPPYKDHMMAFFARAGRKKEDAQLFFGIQPKGAWAGLYVGGHLTAKGAPVAADPSGLAALGRRCGVGRKYLLCTCERYGEIGRRLAAKDDADYVRGPHLVVLRAYEPDEVERRAGKLAPELTECFEELYPLWRRYSNA
jgi:hypothetical protein